MAGSHSFETYEDFRGKARNPGLSPNEKSGFPDSIRAGKQTVIFDDISAKLTALDRPGARILDIGAGCSELSLHVIEMTGRSGQSLTVIDSPEVLALLPDPPHLTKIAAQFPECLKTASLDFGVFDAILAYSVAQHVFAEGSLFAFVDAAAQLLAAEGRFLLGDIPNASMRKRFMASANGKAFHDLHYSHLPKPDVSLNTLDIGQIDDGVVLGLIARMRSAGLHAFIVPQGSALPMANRREDILITRS